MSSGTNITTFHFLTENNQLGQDDDGEHEQTFYLYPHGVIDGHWTRILIFKINIERKPSIFIHMAFAKVKLLEATDVKVQELQLDSRECERNLQQVIMYPAMGRTW